MKMTFGYSVHYQDVDANRHLRLYTLEDMLLDVAGKAADRLGIGYHDLLRDNMAWVLIKMTIELDYMPTVGDQLEFDTWVNAFAHALSPREYQIFLKTDTERFEIGRVHSVWAVLNLSTRQMENIFSEERFQKIDTHELLPISSARLKRIAEPMGTDNYVIRYSDLDYNRHCNSCKYLEMMLDANHRIVDNLTESDHIVLHLSYSREVHYDEHVTINYAEQNDEIQYDVIAPDGLISAQAKLIKK